MIEQTKIILKYLLRRLRDPSKKIKKLLSAEQDLSFDNRRRVFSFINEKLTIHELTVIRSAIMKELRGIRPLTYVKIDDIITGYYDKCLERYLYERLNRHKLNEDTCWFKYAQNNKNCGWVDKDKTFGSSERKQVLYRILKRKPNFKIDVDKMSMCLERDCDGYVYIPSDRIHKEDDNVLPLYRSIKRKGFSNIISSLSPIILGYSKKTGRYNAISGRHRIAALRYLRSQGEIGNRKVRCHIVEHPFETLVYTGPHTESCRRCLWGDEYDLGSGTHQDFHVREGVAVMRGNKNQKGGKQKWARMLPVFKEVVLNKNVLDVGAHRGMYCIKALEYGASHVTALEPAAHLVDVLHTIRESYVFDDLEVIRGDFYNDYDYTSLIKNKYDTVFLFGIIHHLLRIGIQKGILYSFDELFQRISNIAGYGIIVEFAMPTEKNLSLPELVPYRAAFSHEVFEMDLRKTFPRVKNLGRCKYRSGNRYGRFMYYGRKE